MAHELRNLPSEAGLVRGLSRKGNCYDNAHMESRFHGLKTEMVYFEDFRSMEKGMRELRDTLATTARLNSRPCMATVPVSVFLGKSRLRSEILFDIAKILA